MSIIKSATRGVPVTLQDHVSSGNGEAIAIPPSFRQHQITVEGFSVFVEGSVQPETAETAADTVWAPLGGGPIVVPDGKVVYNFEGTFGAIRCPVTTEIANDGECVVTYRGTP